MLKTLFIINAPLGDTINFSCIFKDYKQLFKNEQLYVLCMQQFKQLFKTNSIVSMFNPSLSYDKIFKYELAKFDNSQKGKEKFQNLCKENISLQDTPYLYFKIYYNLDIPHNNYVPCIQLDEYQKTIIQSDKPICLINNISQFFGFDARSWNTYKYQQIIDRYKDKINFIAIGNTNYNLLSERMPLNNLYLNLINNTSIYQLLHYIYNADFILTSQSGIYHICNIISNKQRNIIVIGGSRQTLKMNKYKTNNIIVHWIENINKEYYAKKCFNNSDINGCCTCQLLQDIYVNTQTFHSDVFCKLPVFNNNEILSHCLNNIIPQQIYPIFDNYLK